MEMTLFEHLSALLQTIVLAAITLWFGWKSGFYVSVESKQHRYLNVVNILSVFSIFILMPLVIVPIVSWLGFSIFFGELIPLTALKPGSPFALWINILAVGGSFLGVAAYTHRLSHEKHIQVWRSGAFEGFKKTVKDIFMGFIALVLCYPWVALLIQISLLLNYLFFNLKEVDQEAVKILKALQGKELLFISMTLDVVLIAPILEEMLFRGYLQSWFKSIWGVKAGILISSLLFTLFHFSAAQGIQNLAVLSVLFVLSLYLGYICERQQSLFASIGLHVFFNLTSVLRIIFWS